MICDGFYYSVKKKIQIQDHIEITDYFHFCHALDLYHLHLLVWSFKNR